MSVTAAAGVIVTPPLPPPLYLPAVTGRYQKLQHPVLITMVTIRTSSTYLQHRSGVWQQRQHLLAWITQAQ